MSRLIDVPTDIQEFGERHGIPQFASATYRNGYEQCIRDTEAQRKALLKLIEMADHQAKFWRSHQRAAKDRDDKTRFAVRAEPWENAAMAGRFALEKVGASDVA